MDKSLDSLILGGCGLQGKALTRDLFWHEVSSMMSKECPNSVLVAGPCSVFGPFSEPLPLENWRDYHWFPQTFVTKKGFASWRERDTPWAMSPVWDFQIWKSFSRKGFKDQRKWPYPHLLVLALLKFLALFVCTEFLAVIIGVLAFLLQIFGGSLGRQSFLFGGGGPISCTLTHKQENEDLALKVLCK